MNRIRVMAELYLRWVQEKREYTPLFSSFFFFVFINMTSLPVRPVNVSNGKEDFI